MATQGHEVLAVEVTREGRGRDGERRARLVLVEQAPRAVLHQLEPADLHPATLRLQARRRPAPGERLAVDAGERRVGLGVVEAAQVDLGPGPPDRAACR